MKLETSLQQIGKLKKHLRKELDKVSITELAAHIGVSREAIYKVCRPKFSNVDVLINYLEKTKEFIRIQDQRRAKKIKSLIK